MPVKPLMRIIECGGWKHDDNNRFGAVVVGILETYNATTGEIKVFHFAPTLDDCFFLEDLVRVTREVDKHNKAVLNLKNDCEEVGRYEKQNPCVKC